MATRTHMTPFASAAHDLAALGYTAIPLIPHDWEQHTGRGKCPGEYRSGHWQGMSKWQRFRDSTPSAFELGLWAKAPGANIGLVMGTSVGRDLQVVSLDFDATDPDALDTLLRAAPASPMVKRGHKGETRFYLAPKSLKTASYDGPDGRLMDRLTGYDTRQTVVPPSIHPATGSAYVWLAGPVAADELPTLTDEDIEALEEALEQCGWSKERAQRTNSPRRQLVCGQIDPDDPWSVAKAAALANLDAWVPALDIYGCRPARGGFEAVATWRPSSTGRPIPERKLNLSIQRDGIKDFGTNDTYSAIDLVQHALDLTASKALVWLQEKLGIKDEDDGIVIDLQMPDGKTPPAALEVVATEGVEVLGGARILAEAMGRSTHGVTETLPAHLLDCPGLIGDMTDWMARTAKRPLYRINLLTALAVLGTVAGRRFVGPTDSGLVIYGLALAGTGTGKAHPIKAAQQMLGAAGLAAQIAPSSWMSGSALVQHIARAPSCLSFSDEVAEFFAKLNGARASSHERAVSGIMRELWGINGGVYVPPGWASSNTRAAMPTAIHAPAYSFLGYSVPEATWQALQGSDVINGFLNRFLLITEGKDGADQDPEESVFDVPQPIIDQLRAVANVGGPLASVTMYADQPCAPMVKVPWADGRQGRANALFKELCAYCNTHTAGESLMKRTAEMALRLATIRAIGASGASAAVTLEDMDWGRNVALWSAERMIADAEAFMSDSDWQQKALAVLRVIKSAEGAMTRTALYRKVNHRYPPRELDAILDGLATAGQIVVENSTRTGARGPAPKAYRAVQ